MPLIVREYLQLTLPAVCKPAMGLLSHIKSAGICSWVLIKHMLCWCSVWAVVLADTVGLEE